MAIEERERFTHPSYGMIRASRIHGNSGKLFGSELEIDHYIEIEVQHGSMDRELSNDWFYASHTSPVVQLRMSPLQFAEFVTSLNCGDGVPCTLEYADGKKVEQQTSNETKKEATHRQFKDRMKMFASRLLKKRDEAKDLVKKKTLSKEDQRQLLLHLDWLTQEITRNIPFFMECFQEVADRVVAESKAEVEAAIMHKITTLGLAELQNQNKLLGDGK